MKITKNRPKGYEDVESYGGGGILIPGKIYYRSVEADNSDPQLISTLRDHIIVYLFTHI